MSLTLLIGRERICCLNYTLSGTVLASITTLNKLNAYSQHMFIYLKIIFFNSLFLLTISVSSDILKVREGTFFLISIVRYREQK